MSSIGVVLDACVLFPGSLRDILLRAAEVDLYRLCLTDQIVEEMRRNLVKKRQMTEIQAQYLVQEMKKSFSDAFEIEHIPLIPDMPVNEKDRHVLAAAVSSGSQFIVTANLKDFPQQVMEQFEIKALSADDFLIYQFSQDRETMINIVREHTNSSKNPPLSLEEVLGRLKKVVPMFTQVIQGHI
jgi:predicted nucleic acid-binding protein